MKLLFVNPHPDDTEFTSASTCKQAVDRGWDVYQLLITSDEYSTSRNDFKGKRIRKIRIHEMEEAAKLYGLNPDGTSKVKLVWFGEIDGYLPFNREVYLRLRKIVIDLNPDIVIGPDSFFSLDLHPDHKHTGWLIYIVVKSIEILKRPILLLYHSTNANLYIPIKDHSIHAKTLVKHRSQFTPFYHKLLTQMRKIFYNLRRMKTGPVISEGFRRVYFKQGENQIKKLIHKIFYIIVLNVIGGLGEKRYLPTPKELGLKL
jgi:LmbE family N-acetylglucosaminyl deacetylase